jgi:hypothetical protein
MFRPGGPFPADAPIVLGFAFDPSGESLAVAYLAALARGPMATLAVLDAKSGREKGGAHTFPFPAVPAPGNDLFWWGSHVVVSPSPISGVVIDPASGRQAAAVVPRSGGELLRDTGDGGSLWGFGRLVPDGSLVVYALAFPEAFPTGGKSPGRTAATPNGFMEAPPPEKKEPKKQEPKKGTKG